MYMYIILYIYIANCGKYSDIAGATYNRDHRCYRGRSAAMQIDLPRQLRSQQHRCRSLSDLHREHINNIKRHRKF